MAVLHLQPLHINNLSATLGLVSCSKNIILYIVFFINNIKTSVFTFIYARWTAKLVYCCLKRLFDLLDGESYQIKSHYYILKIHCYCLLTRGKRLSQLVGLGLVLDNQSVEVARASDLKLDRISVLLDTGSCWKWESWVRLVKRVELRERYLHLASFLRAISRNCLISLICLG